MKTEVKYRVKITAFFFLTAACVALSIWGPESMAKYRDKSTLGQIHAETIEEASAGYRYELNANERLYILSRCLSSQTLPESEQNAMTHVDMDHQDLEGSYAFVVNYRGPSGKEITNEEIFDTCNEALHILKEAGILPEEVRDVEPTAYDAVLYSAIDVLEPRNNIAVWKMSLSNSQKNANKDNRLIDAYIDADDGRLYEFYVRTPLLWEDIDADEIIEKWSKYMGLGSPVEYESDNPLLEVTPYYKKYVFPGMGEETTVVTVGFFEGINELFLKISR